MPLSPSFVVDHAFVASLVKLHWDGNLVGVLKQSPNHTFVATKDREKMAVRVVPDSGDKISR
jgi:hypothetical protein